MNPTPMEDPAVKALAFEAALPQVTAILDAIANAPNASAAARAQGFALSKSTNPLDDDERTELEAEVDNKTFAIVVDVIQRMLPVTQRIVFDEGRRARDNYDAQALKAAEDMVDAQKSKSNG